MVPAAASRAIAVSFTGTDDRLTGYSCTGTQVDLAAPGDNIMSPVPTGACMFMPYGYNWASGTSMASPRSRAWSRSSTSAGIADGNGNGLLADDVSAPVREHVPGRGDGHGGPRYNWYGCGIVDADKALIDNPPGGGGGGGTAPTAVDDAATTSEDTATDIAVLTNDTDPTVALDSHGCHRPAARHRDREPERGPSTVPDAQYSGPDTFGYTVADTTAQIDTGSVAVTVTAVNDAPVAVNDPATTPEDTSTLIDVRSSDTDIDGGPLVHLDRRQPGPRHGGGRDPARSGTHRRPATAGRIPSATPSPTAPATAATVSVTVTAVNDPPVAAADTAATSEDVSRLVNVLANDTDIDGGALVIASVGSPGHGTTAIESGQVRYAGTRLCRVGLLHLHRQRWRRWRRDGHGGNR